MLNLSSFFLCGWVAVCVCDVDSLVCPSFTGSREVESAECSQKTMPAEDKHWPLVKYYGSK